MIQYPTGVENHGGKLRIWFLYKGVRVRENLGVPDSPKNRKKAGELRNAICYAIKTGTFDYAAQFPDSHNLARFGEAKPNIDFATLTDKWLSLKQIDVCKNTYVRYKAAIKNVMPYIGARTLIASINQEFLLSLRKELLVGFQHPKHWHTEPVKGRTASTVNYYLRVVNGALEFAKNNGYLPSNPMQNLVPLKRAKSDPDPLTKDEFERLIACCDNRQLKNLWSLAVFTGMRHGELCALAWEDIDLKAGTITVTRNYTSARNFTPPKTEAGTDRKIVLIDAAITVLRDQAELTRLGKQHDISVALREYGKTRLDKCTFVFNPGIYTKNPHCGINYATGSLNMSWASAMRRAGIRHRKAYQSRHTYACWALSAGANPNFIAGQMGHANARMVYQVYGKWMSENDADQLSILNKSITVNAPPMPHSKTAEL
ncbi:site-specific integrase [Cronobacter dublinensis]|uniref:tyrosine-type recombinase/integrase n=1 Tax=Cronobacter TaxID=413496 RepID=UPI0008FBD42E|nr:MULTISPECIES: site-specific integrase [Cronobacter]ELY2855242.1 site-specific integrase [Cronobacter dublinensis]ELY6212226.1 site-specific integrase [Cronobacter dublinensis]MDI7491364.1 site-specific integrase [Cronobacter dublinensis]